MKATAQILDLSALPDAARREVADFYQFPSFQQFPHLPAGFR